MIYSVLYMGDRSESYSAIMGLLEGASYFNSDNVSMAMMDDTENELVSYVASRDVSGVIGSFSGFLFRREGFDVVVVVGVGNSIDFHESSGKSSPNKYLSDWVLYMMMILKETYNVVGVAITIDGDENKYSTYQWNRGDKKYYKKRNYALCSFDEYFSYFYGQGVVVRDEEELLSYAKKIHDEMRDEAKLKEAEKPLLVGAILLALENGAFVREYPVIEDSRELAVRLIKGVEDSLLLAGVSPSMVKILLREYDFISSHPSLIRGKIDIANPSHDNNVLHKFLVDVHRQLYPYLKKANKVDLIGKFYAEFLRYTSNDGKGLGIVLTPTHVAELFAEIAEVDKNSRVIDIAAGTGGFLIAAMNKMLSEDLSLSEIENIHKNNLVGIEAQRDMFTLSCANMVIRGDGETNLHLGNCFEVDTEKIKAYQCDVGMINPPYAQKKDGEHELQFLLRMLSVLKPGGIGVAIVPLSCMMHTGKNKQFREELFSKHSLLAVMSMPDQLFYPTNSVTCVVVFRAHEPHDSTKETWFGYWKYDGYRKMKNRGRVDYKGYYVGGVKDRWLKMYRNREVIPGKSVLRAVDFKDEWLVEAYMKTDYGNLTSLEIQNAIKEYVTYLFYHDLTDEVSKKSVNDPYKFDVKDWKEFLVSDLFKVSGSKTTSKAFLEEAGEGKYPYVTIKDAFNSVQGYFDYYTEEGNVLTIESAVKGLCTYQAENFSASGHVEKLEPLFDMDKYIAMFFVTLFSLERYRYSYGRKFNQERIRNTLLRLPVNESGEVNFEEIRRIVKGVPYSGSL